MNDDVFGSEDEFYGNEDDQSNFAEVQSGVFYCASCGSANDTFIDPSQGKSQEYVEDCQVCCAPNIIFVEWFEEGRMWSMQTAAE
ncbi:MAG: CPXCG motif-containing cysteine-rich protein [Balneolales bacterium]|nr:CPXCG motif-containing cysteine-rich protein [Balneolales bacterium]